VSVFVRALRGTRPWCCGEPALLWVELADMTPTTKAKDGHETYY
jgi:hypothetical protein